MSDKQLRDWERLERSLEEIDKITQECMAKGLCRWCCERPAVTTEGECKECSRLPGHTHAGEDERDDTIASLQRELREAQAGAAVLQEALEHYGVLYDSAFRTHKSGAELLRELDTLKDQDAKLVAALESIRGAQVTGDFGAEAVLEEVQQIAQEALKGENDE